MLSVFDSFRNLVSGLMGGASDKTVNVTPVLDLLTQEQIDNLYRGNWLARKVIDILPGDMTREWRIWQAPPDMVSKIEKAEKQFGIRKKVFDALVWARLYGGAAILTGAGDLANPSLPLLPEQMKKGGLKYVTALPRWYVGNGTLVTDVESPAYGLPEWYNLMVGQAATLVDRSRVIHIRGARGQYWDPWGDSVYQAMRDALLNAGMVIQNTAHLTGESKIDVIKMENLENAVSTPDGRKRVQDRIMLAAQVRSIYSTLVLGASDEFDQKEISLAAYPDLIDRFLQIVCAAADVPTTRFMGRAPGGLNATGESDLKNYYDHVGTLQQRDLRPILEALDAVMWPHLFGEPMPDDVWWTFAPLWQMSDKEQTEVSLNRARALDVINGTGLVPPAVLSAAARGMLSEDPLLPSIDQEWEEFEKDGGVFDPEEGGDENQALEADPAEPGA